MKIKISDIENFIRKYIDNERPRLSKKIEYFQLRYPVNLAMIMPHIRKEARNEFQRYETEFLPLLKDCKTLAEVVDILFDFFEKNRICGIKDQSILDYAENYAYLNDLEMEANCTCLLTNDTKNRMEKVELSLTDVQTEMRKINIYFEQLSSRELVDFLNKYSKDILK